MWVQEAGGAVKEVGPRQTVVTEPGVRHWHGALPGETLTQVAFSFGMTTWMDRVTDEQYSGGKAR
jgi:quercetin dioxygenase-like cupin family protein